MFKNIDKYIIIALLSSAYVAIASIAKIYDSCSPNGDNIVCSETGAICVTGRCRCRFGYARSSTNQFDCRQLMCELDSDCSEIENSICNPTTGRCVCNKKFGYSLHDATQRCRSNARAIFEECDDSRQCGNYAICIDRTCQCSFGYSATIATQREEQQKKSIRDCLPIICASDADCESDFVNSTCDLSRRRCACPAYFRADLRKRACVQVTISASDKIVSPPFVDLTTTAPFDTFEENKTVTISSQRSEDDKSRFLVTLAIVILSFTLIILLLTFYKRCFCPAKTIAFV